MIVIILTVESVVGKHRWLYLPANQFQGVKDGRKGKNIIEEECKQNGLHKTIA